MVDKYNKALEHYNRGDKQGAKRLLGGVVSEEPNNSRAWYGLALCVEDIDEKIYCLKKVLAIDPNHENATKKLEQYTVSSLSSTPTDSKTKICPYCGESIKEIATTCRFCGKDLVPQKKKSVNKNWAYVGIFIVIVLLLSCGFLYKSYNNYQAKICGEREFNQGLEDIENILDRWTLQKNIADDSNVYEISTPISRLKEIRNETSSIQVPTCLKESHSKLLNYMDKEIEWRTAFMLLDFEFFDTHLHDSDIALEQFENALIQANQCDPICR